MVAHQLMSAHLAYKYLRDHQQLGGALFELILEQSHFSQSHYPLEFKHLTHRHLLKRRERLSEVRAVLLNNWIVHPLNARSKF